MQPGTLLRETCSVTQEVDTCVECSAKLIVNVPEVFYHAQKAVLHPTAPLYDSRDHVRLVMFTCFGSALTYGILQVLKKECIAALRRIFKLCDLNKDGVLDNAELNEFQVSVVVTARVIAQLTAQQRKCFDTPLQAQELEGIKEMALAHTAGGVRDGGLTEEGFLYLLTSFIQRGRQETTWTALRKFGYGEDLKLTEDFLYPKCVFFFFHRICTQSVSDSTYLTIVPLS